MVKVGLFVKLEAKAGKEAELKAFLETGLQLAQQEAKIAKIAEPRPDLRVWLYSARGMRT